MNSIEAFRAEMRRAGLDYTGLIHADGKLHRFKTEGDKARNSWYVLHSAPDAGVFGCWRRGFKESWSEKKPKDYTAAEFREVQMRWKQADEEERLRHKQAQKTAAWILNRAMPVQSHPYLERKAVRAYGALREYRGALTLPLRDSQGELYSLQFISADGTKRFLSGGRIAGCFFTIADKADGPLVLVEGLATGVSAFEATGFSTVAAMNCGNVLPVAKALRAKWPGREIIVGPDNDEWTVGNPGMTKGRAAAKAISAKLAVPIFKDTSTKPTDFNDLHQLEGLDTVKTQIEAATEPDNQTPPGVTDSRDLIHDTRPKVQLPGDDHLLSQTAEAVGKILAKENIFSRGGLVFTLDKNGDRLTLMTPSTLRTWIEDFLVLYRIREVGAARELIEFARTISEADAKGILDSPQFQRCLRPIERLNPIRVPVMQNGVIRLLPEGYDAETKSFTFNPINIDDIRASEGKRIIDELFCEFIFADTGRSRAVAVAGMLAVFGFGLLPPKSLRPCFIYMANAEGAGKGLLVKCATVPVLGYAPMGTKPNDEDEMKKSLLTAVLEARPVIIFDNVKKHLASPALEGFLTAQTYGDRVLGASKSFQGENNTIVFVTGNGCTVSPDMRRRSLFCELLLEVERAEDRVFKNDLEVPALLARRAEIVSALWALIRDWDKANRPRPSRGNSSFSEWSNIIGGTVQHAGYGCALETPQIESAADTDGADMRAMVKAIAAGANLKQVTFEEITEAARADGLFTRIITDGQDLDARGKAMLAALLKRYDRRLIGGYRFTLLGKGRNRRFQVEENRQ